MSDKPSIAFKSDGMGTHGASPKLVTNNQGLLASNIGKRFKKRPVLRDVTLKVQRGEAVGLLGPNGAGKTTCFYIITGLIFPDYGSIVLDGHDITDLPMYRRARLGIGHLPQEASIFRGLTVENNIRAVLEVVEPVRDTVKPCSTICLLSSRFRICGEHRPSHCREGNGAGLKSRVLWRRGRAS